MSRELAPGAGAMRERLRQRRAPNVPLLDHEGHTLRFYDDVVRGQCLVLNVMYAGCSTICSPSTQRLVEARRLLGPAEARLQFVSITLQPLADRPDDLKAYRQKHGISDGWRFLTGKPEHVEQVQRALGFLDDNGASATDHSAMVVVWDEPRLRWGHASTLTSARSIARSIRFELA